MNEIEEITIYYNDDFRGKLLVASSWVKSLEKLKSHTAIRKRLDCLVSKSNDIFETPYFPDSYSYNYEEKALRINHK